LGIIIIPTDELIFFRGVETTNQEVLFPNLMNLETDLEDFTAFMGRSRLKLRCFRRQQQLLEDEFGVSAPVW